MDVCRAETSILQRALLEVLEYLLPCPCLSCDRPTGAWRPRLGLCVPCRGRLRPLETACAQCGEPLDATGIPSGYRCGRCRRRPPAFDRLVASWVYEPPLDLVVRELKFGGLFYLAAHLGEAIASGAGSLLNEVDQIVPVPLHWRRQLVRGYNQAAEIAHRVGSLLELPVVHALRRRRSTPPQTALPHQDRKHNLRGAFRVHGASRVAGAQVALIDDVATTGATLDSCARALNRAGAARVVAVVAGRTAPPAGRNLEGLASQRSHQLSGPSRRAEL